ncbi:MAG TPA: M20/M25/M40 family metallo-hydrolase [Acidobacteriota bacterium]|nr:M20/M25/M40 family metallo-hydrolase [Acidobacteriota bacterium]
MKSELKIAAIMLVSLTLICSYQTAVQAQASDPGAKAVREKVKGFRVAYEKKIVLEFADLLSIPCVASDSANIGRNAKKIVEMMEARGISVRLLEVPGSPPLVYGERLTPGADKTIAVYVHYDGQPVVPELWVTGPWEPTLRDKRLELEGQIIRWSDIPDRLDGEWRLYARGSGDDKAPVIAWLTAIDALGATDIPLSVNVKFFFEGEEEAGSLHLGEILESHKDLLKADVLFICDGPVHQSRRMQLFFGVRGITGVEMTTYGPTNALHSGHYGNWAPNPGALLANLLATMRDNDGRILIDGFYDHVRPLSEFERRVLDSAPDPDDELRKTWGMAQTEADNARLIDRIQLPALNIRGIRVGEIGSEVKNAVPTQAVANIGFRLVPDLDPLTVRELVENHLRKQGYYIVSDDPDMATRLAHPRIVKLVWEDGYPAARTSMDLPVSRAVIKLIEDATADPLVTIPSLGGSLPLYLFIDKFRTPVIGLPMANHDNNQHGPNENLRLQNLYDSIEVNAAILARLGYLLQE